MIPESSFLFAIAGISGSLAGLGGLVAGLRRGTDLRGIDLYRLREIVEFAFGNVLLALSLIPLAMVTSTADAVRIDALAVLALTVVHVLVLDRRTRREGIPSFRAWIAIAVTSDLAILALVAATIVSGSFAPFAALLLVLLVRPMLAFLLVLASLEVPERA